MFENFNYIYTILILPIGIALQRIANLKTKTAILQNEINNLKDERELINQNLTKLCNDSEYIKGKVDEISKHTKI